MTSCPGLISLTFIRISIILDAMLPTDISEQIRLLEKYVKSAFDVIGLLPRELGTRIFRELSVHEVLKVSTVKFF
jgi:pyrimidine and pyridine-specific 5'-nucleotidase